MRARFFSGLGVLAVMSVVGSGPPLSSSAAARPAEPGGFRSPRPTAISGQSKRPPLAFIPNAGGRDERTVFSVLGENASIGFDSDGLTFVLAAPDDRRRGKNDPAPAGRADRCWVARLEFEGAKENVRPVGKDETGAAISFFKGKEADWKTGLPAYSRIEYAGLWPGIDLVFSGTDGALEYEFVVHPGADPARIRLAYRGVESAVVDENGGLKVRTPMGILGDAKPVARQESGGLSREIPVAFALERGTGGDKAFRYGFSVGSYDRTLTLILDPAIVLYCGYIGGDFRDWGYGIAADRSGNTYVAGTTPCQQNLFPVKVGPDLTHNGYGTFDAFVAKINPKGQIVYCGYIGGDDYDEGWAIALDGKGNAYVAGGTSSTPETFPVKTGPGLTHHGKAGTFDAFVAKVNPQGTGLVYCGYIGGDANDVGQGIAVDGDGNAFITGYTASIETSFPVRTGPDLTYNGGLCDAFVAKVDVQGAGLVYCGYIGGDLADYGNAIALDRQGNAYLTGNTTSSELTFPVRKGPDVRANGGIDAFMAKITASGAALSSCGYIGGNGHDYGRAIAVDRAGNAYVAGETSSTERTFPVKFGPDLTYNGGYYDAFVAKVDALTVRLVYCGYIGGNLGDYGRGIALDGAENAYLAGTTGSSEKTFPVKGGPGVKYRGGYSDVFVARVNARGDGLGMCGYLGGNSEDQGWALAVDGAGNMYVTGCTYSTSSTFPLKGGPVLKYNGFGDAFVAKIQGDGWIKVTSPDGGETWPAGTTQTIRWTRGGSLGKVRINYSIDNGAHWTNINASAPNTGRYAWRVPRKPSTACLVKVCEAADKFPSDESNAPFTIEN